jgi:hypothetical protein
LYTSSEKPTTQSSTFHFARASQNKKSLPFPNAHPKNIYRLDIKIAN